MRACCFPPFLPSCLTKSTSFTDCDLVLSLRLNRRLRPPPCLDGGEEEGETDLTVECFLVLVFLSSEADGDTTRRWRHSSLVSEMH